SLEDRQMQLARSHQPNVSRPVGDFCRQGKRTLAVPTCAVLGACAGAVLAWRHFRAGGLSNSPQAPAACLPFAIQTNAARAPRRRIGPLRTSWEDQAPTWNATTFEVQNVNVMLGGGVKVTVKP